MKIYCLAFIGLLSLTDSFAQDLESGGSNSWIFHTPDDGRSTLFIAPKIDNSYVWGNATQFLNNGNVLLSGKLGVGISPTQQITVNGSINIVDPTLGNYLGFGHPDENEYNTLGSLQSSAGFAFAHGLKPSKNDSKLIYSHGTMSRSAIILGKNFASGGITFYTRPNSSEIVGDQFLDAPRMVIEDGGNVGIGTVDTKGYKLAVAGNMIAESIKVSLQGTWPDYVFVKDHQLLTLQETEKHIKDKGHLPGIPSAAEVKANGIDLGEMNAKLLQKIEELTLHLIEKEKEIKRLEKLSDRVTNLEAIIVRLTNKQ